ncbi:MAG: DUF2934 domain-containing protein [Pseudomonadota bacterium]
MANKNSKGRDIVERKAQETLTTQSSTSQANYERVAARAYELYEKRGRTNGADMDDWLQAEKELLERK